MAPFLFFWICLRVFSNVFAIAHAQKRCSLSAELLVFWNFAARKKLSITMDGGVVPDKLAARISKWLQQRLQQPFSGQGHSGQVKSQCQHTQPMESGRLVNFNN